MSFQVLGFVALPASVVLWRIVSVKNVGLFTLHFVCFTGNALEVALQKINREDVVRKCMYNVEVVDDEVEAAAARVAMDQSGEHESG